VRNRNDIVLVSVVYSLSYEVLPETQSRSHSGIEKGGFGGKRRMVLVPRTLFGKVAIDFIGV
jgi:hypothetical protein